MKADIYTYLYILLTTAPIHLTDNSEQLGDYFHEYGKNNLFFGSAFS